MYRVYGPNGSEQPIHPRKSKSIHGKTENMTYKQTRMWGKRAGTRLTGKKFCPIPGPPGMPSFGGIWPSGLGAGPAFCAKKVETKKTCQYNASQEKTAASIGKPTCPSPL